MPILLAGAFLVAWVALYILVVRPKLVAFRYTAGIYRRLDALEADGWPRLVLRLKGAKVAIVALITSAAPIVAVGWDKMQGTDWTQLSHARPMDVAMFALGIAGPMLMAALHSGALAEASAAEPVAAEPVAAPAAKD